MRRSLACKPSLLRQAGLTLVEMMVSITISLVVLSGVVQVLVVSKSNFITVREMASMQENARFALKYLTDEIRMAGYSGCASPLKVANSVTGSSGTWYLDVGLRGYEYDAGVATYPTEFRSDVRANTDAIAIRRGDVTGLRVTDHNPSSARIDVNAAHSYKPGQILMIANPDCEQVGVF
ncbi:MAG: prepilin-type N-terminal cleavage/methylation domain-containing protein, partial [Pseudomonadota bacterium]